MAAARRPVLVLVLVLALAAVALAALAFAPGTPLAVAPTQPPLAPTNAPAMLDAATAVPPVEPTRIAAPTSTPSVPTPLPALEVHATARDDTLTFQFAGQAPAGADQALVWLDTAAGRVIRRVPLAPGAPNPAGMPSAFSATVSFSATQVISAGDLVANVALDYWVAVPGANAPLRRAGTLRLPPEIAAIGQAAPLTPTMTISWTERLTPHFRLYAPPGSDGARDLGRLADVAEAGYTQATALLSPTAPLSVSVYLTPRVFWQGGVAYGRNGPLIISYLDRNYAGVETWSYFVHEVTHAISAALLPEGAEIGGVLGEGVAVVATGGHYGLEPIDARAATIAASDEYVPLCRLRFDFYAAQHETAYIESASFVQYLLRTYGQTTFLELYRAQQAQRGGREQTVEQFCAADDARIAAPTGKTVAELEREWRASLAGLRPTDDERRGWELTVRLYDTMRRYQELFDPPARVLPPAPKDWKNDDAFRALVPATGRRAAMLEPMLVAASDALRTGDVGRAEALLDAVSATLDHGGTPTQDLARRYDALARLLETQARAIRLGDQATLAVTLADPLLAARLPFATSELLYDLRLAPVRLDIDGTFAEGIVEATGASLDGRTLNGALFRARFAYNSGSWKLAAWEPFAPEIAMPPGVAAVQ